MTSKILESVERTARLSAGLNERLAADDENARLRGELTYAQQKREDNWAEVERLRAEMEESAKVIRQRGELDMSVRYERNEALNRVCELRTENARLRSQIADYKHALDIAVREG